MFEREFEFTVYHPLEVCEEHVRQMKTPGCFTRFFQPITADIVPYHDYAKFYVSQSLGSRAGSAKLEGTIEPVSKSECVVTGIADVRNVAFLLVFFTIIAVTMIASAVREQAWWLIAFVTCWYSLAWLQFIHYRNRLIKTFEKALNQPKKKS
jgi:hypothetical protein